MIRFWSCAGLAVTWGAAAASAALPPKVTPSANESFSVEVTQPESGRMEATVFRLDEGARTLLWSRTVNWHFNPGFGAAQLAKALVSNDGQTVILRNTHPTSDPADFWVLRKDGQSASLSHQDLGSAPEPPAGFFLRGPGLLFEGALGFFSPQEDFYALWSAREDRWLVISLPDLQHSVPTDPAEIRRLNDLGRAQALEKVRAHQPGTVRTLLGALREQFGQFLPSLAPRRSRAWITPETASAYIFLAVRKNPADKAWIERLLRHPLHERAGWSNSSHMGKFMAEISSNERILGDLLLSWWEGRASPENYRGLAILVPKEPLTSLASLRLQVQLPIQVPDAPGMLWVWLIPADIPAGQWSESTRVVPLRLDLSISPRKPFSQPYDSSQAEFHFTGMHPGKYRVKAVWDRRPPVADSQARIALPGPGDYESSESEEFTLQAGELLENLMLVCTNRLPGPQDYYAADELLGKQNAE